MKYNLNNICTILNFRNIILFFFCLVALSGHIYLHESAHYLAAKFVNLDNPQLHFASMTIQNNLTAWTPGDKTDQILLSSIIILKASGPLLTIVLTLFSIIYLTRKYNDFVFIFGLVPLFRICNELAGIPFGQIFGDEYYFIKLLAYYTPWWENDYIINLLFLMLLFVELFIASYPIFICLKKNKICGADYKFKSSNIWGIFLIFLAFYFWNFQWMNYIGPKLLP